MISLSKIVDGMPAADDALPNHNLIRCPRCTQEYRLDSSDSEWNKLHGWIGLAETAIRASHPAHTSDSLELIWKPPRGRR